MKGTFSFRYRMPHYCDCSFRVNSFRSRMFSSSSSLSRARHPRNLPLSIQRSRRESSFGITVPPSQLAWMGAISLKGRSVAISARSSIPESPSNLALSLIMISSESLGMWAPPPMISTLVVNLRRMSESLMASRLARTMSSRDWQMKGSQMDSPTMAASSAPTSRTWPPPLNSSKQSSGSSARSQKREQGLKGSRSSGMSKAFQISLKKELEATQMVSEYAICRATSLPFLRGLISQILLMVSSGSRTAQAISLMRSRWKRSASEGWSCPMAGSEMRSLKILASILLMSLLPKFFLIRVLGRITPSSTQHTLIFSWPMSTTQAELTAVPKQAMMLSRWMYSLRKPMRLKSEPTSIFTCLRTKTSPTIRMQLKLPHSFSGILIFCFSRYTSRFSRSPILSPSSHSPATFRAPWVITFRKMYPALSSTLRASSPNRAGLPALWGGMRSMPTTCLALGLPLKGLLSGLITPSCLRVSSTRWYCSLNHSSSKPSSDFWRSGTGCARLQATKGATVKGAFSLAKPILMECEPSCSTMVLLPLSSSLQMQSLLACRFFMVFCIASLDSAIPLEYIQQQTNGRHFPSPSRQKQAPPGRRTPRSRRPG